MVFSEKAQVPVPWLGLACASKKRGERCKMCSGCYSINLVTGHLLGPMALTQRYKSGSKTTIGIEKPNLNLGECVEAQETCSLQPISANGREVCTDGATLISDGTGTMSLLALGLFAIALKEDDIALNAQRTANGTLPRH